MLKKIISLVNYYLLIGIITILILIISIASKDIKKVLLTEESNWPPYTYESENASINGISFLMMNELFKRLEIEFEYKLYPQKRCISQMKSGERDAITMISKNHEREQYLEFTLPLMEATGFMYYNSKRIKQINWVQYEDLKPYVIGIVRGYNYGKDFKDASQKYNLYIEEVIRLEQNFDKLLSGRIDIMLANNIEMKEFLKKNPKYLNHIKAAEKPYYHYSYHMAFSKKSEARKLIPIINKVIMEMKKDGTLDKILSKFL